MAQYSKQERTEDGRIISRATIEEALGELKSYARRPGVWREPEYFSGKVRFWLGTMILGQPISDRRWKLLRRLATTVITRLDNPGPSKLKAGDTIVTEMRPDTFSGKPIQIHRPRRNGVRSLYVLDLRWLLYVCVYASEVRLNSKFHGGSYTDRFLAWYNNDARHRLYLCEIALNAPIGELPWNKYGATYQATWEEFSQALGLTYPQYDGTVPSESYLYKMFRSEKRLVHPHPRNNHKFTGLHDWTFSMADFNRVCQAISTTPRLRNRLLIVNDLQSCDSQSSTVRELTAV